MMDSVSSEYGWSDEYILSLRYPRLQQIARVIAERQKDDSALRHSYAQLFYNLIAVLRPWEGSPPRLHDIFTHDVPARAQTEQYRADLWWTVSHN